MEDLNEVIDYESRNVKNYTKKTKLLNFYKNFLYIVFTRTFFLQETSLQEPLVYSLLFVVFRRIFFLRKKIFLNFFFF